MQYLKETTSDWKVQYKVPCHTYMFASGKCVGYIREGFTEPFFFKTPMKQFNKRKRSFIDVSKDYRKIK
jgi:hypothetical protein